MGRIQLDVFLTLDGVAQAPGGREEDPEGGFRFGGWQAPLGDPETGEQIMAVIAATDALLLGRKTYELWAGHWPRQDENGPEGEIVRRFNSVPKYVVSHTLTDPSWAGTTVIGDDLAAELAAIRDRHELTHIWGSIDLCQSLFTAGLIDQLVLWVYPLVLGEGKRILDSGVVPSNLRLLEPATTSAAGVVCLRYAVEGTEPATGEMGASS